MKSSLFLLLLLFAHICYGRETAYQALRTVTKEKDQLLLNHVLEVTGENGMPQPSIWKILVEDRFAPGGLRELEVKKGQIISEHTPKDTLDGVDQNSIIDFSNLNLDSSGAFTIAMKEASNKGTRFEKVNYVLHCENQKDPPVWILNLIDSREQEVGTLYIASDTGAILWKEGFNSSSNPKVKRKTVKSKTTRQRLHESGRDLGKTVDKTFHHIGGSLQEFFTGRRTIDKKYRKR